MKSSQPLPFVKYAPRVGRDPPAAGEVDREDEDVEAVRHADDLVEVGIPHEDRQEEVDDRQDRDAEDEDLPRQSEEDLAVRGLGLPRDVRRRVATRDLIDPLILAGHRTRSLRG